MNDTSVAWTALRESANREKIASLESERRGSAPGRFKKLADAVLFIKRTSTVDAHMTNQDDVLSYDEEFVVSVTNSRLRAVSLLLENPRGKRSRARVTREQRSRE